MNLKWKKLGIVFEPTDRSGWLKSHAQCPTAIVLEDRIRVFFSGRLANQMSLPTFIDVDLNQPNKILFINKNPILKLGETGTFDEHGIIPSYLIKVNGKIYFYYAGWSQAKSVPYKNFTGLAISNDNGLTFKKISSGPCFPMDISNPLSATGPAIAYIKDKWQAIYSTGTAWHLINEHLEHVYILKRASSEDAISWKFYEEQIIEPESPYHAYCKPALLFKEGIWHMWYSYRGSFDFREKGKNAYKLGYANSKNFINWDKCDKQVGITISNEGWDSQMICYPNIVEANGKAYMFYNGNGFGKSGFGVAELTQ